MSYRAPDGLLRNVQQKRLTPKSDELLKIEARQALMQEQASGTNSDPAFDDSLLPELLRRMAT